MTLPLSSFALAEKNKLATANVWLIALKITIPGVADPIRVVQNNENVTWAGFSWIAFPFELDPITEESKGEVPRVVLRVSNVSRVMDAYIQTYDVYCKTNGVSPVTLNIYILNSGNLSDATPVAEYIYDLIQPKLNAIWATFVLGASNPFTQRFPPYRILKNHCRYVFKDANCAYAGGIATCNKTLARCREIFGSSDPRFGGFPGVGIGGIRFA